MKQTSKHIGKRAIAKNCAGAPFAQRAIANNALAKLLACLLSVALACAISLTASGCTSANNPSSSQASPAPASQQLTSSPAASQASSPSAEIKYTFRSNRLLKEHYQKHGKEMGFPDAQSYVAGANAVIANSQSLHKTQKEDGDDVFYLQETDEIVIVSQDGYIRTYFNPGGIGYYNRQ